MLHVGLILAYLSAISAYFHYSVVLCLLPLLLIQGVYFKRLRHGQLPFCQPRQWQFYNGQARLKRYDNWVSVDVRAHQVWPSCVIMQYRQCATNPMQKAEPWQWEIIIADACDAECHRQLVALMRQQYQGKN
ncbi:hypothetical protein ACU6U9_13495 [Pseudomonas sp. HK3]